MVTGAQLLKEGKYQELWQRYCGFLDLSLEGFMAIQRHLLLEQLSLLQSCKLGRHLLRGATPDSVEAFQEQVPLTTYADYAPFLMEQQEEVLPAKPVLWQRTSGASGEYPFKYAPITQRMYQEMGPVAFAILVLATCRGRGEIGVEGGENMFYALAPPPYATGCWGRRAAEELPLNFLPPLEAAEAMSFEERLVNGLRLGLFQGIDLIFGLPSVLVALGEQMGQRSQQQSLWPLLRRPRALCRVLKALARSKLARRPLLPRDLWTLRGLATVGSDASIYRERLKELWGRLPLDVYGCTEGFVIAMQAWDYQSMSFLPHMNFLEFIPEEERARAEVRSSYKPRILPLDQVEEGKNYELVITNFHGGAFVRYRLGDMVTIVSRRNAALEIDTPQMVFYSRCDGIIDLAGFARLTEKGLWQAMAEAGVPCRDWVVRKEERHGMPVMHLYLELHGDGVGNPREIGEALHQQLKLLDRPYAEMELFLGLRPVEVTLLPQGTFSRYVAHQRAVGAELAHLKPPRMNPSGKVLATLLTLAGREAVPLEVGV